MRAGVVGLLILAGSAFALRQEPSASTENPENLYAQHCARCHDTGNARTVGRAAMKKMGSGNVRFALTKGRMSAQGQALTGSEIETLSAFLAGPQGDGLTNENRCPMADDSQAGSQDDSYWDGWGNGPEQHRFQTAAMAQLSQDQVPRLKLKWAFGFPDVSRMYGQPSVMHGRLFVGSANRKVYSLNAETGCLYWEFTADYPVRTAISFGGDPAHWSIYFGDQHANAYSVNAWTGKLEWKTSIEDHPAAIITGAPLLAGGKLLVPASSYEEALGADPKYECCTFRGSLSALDPSTGKVLWKAYTIPEPPEPTHKSKQGAQLRGPSGVAVWSAPSVDLQKRRVYIATGDSYSDPPAHTSDAFLAFDINDGKLLWKRQVTAGDAYTVDCGLPVEMRTNCPEHPGPDADFGSSPILVKLKGGRRELVAGQKSGVVYAVDPDRKGKILWQTRIGDGGPLGGIQYGAAVEGNRMYVALSDVHIRAAAEGTAGAQKSIMGGLLQLDPNTGGGLFALDLKTGEIVWHMPHPGCQGKAGCSPGQSAAVTAIPGMVFSGGLDGHIRAYSNVDGRITWDFDTEREFKTVNGVAANGGSMDGPGPVIVGGLLYVGSGYGYLGQTPGNALLAFSVDGK
jgi:polyvinyl alcohol dehydrogenase (cytochrome)